MVTGRPPLFSTVEELDLSIRSYFEWIKGNGESIKPQPPTVTGLALYLGFASRQSFYDYEKDGEFSYTIKKARLRIECEYEKALHSNSPTGAIFALKNFGWKDKQEVEQSGGLTIKFEDPGSYVYPSQDQGDSGIPESI